MTAPSEYGDAQGRTPELDAFFEDMSVFRTRTAPLRTLPELLRGHAEWLEMVSSTDPVTISLLNDAAAALEATHAPTEGER